MMTAVTTQPEPEGTECYDLLKRAHEAIEREPRELFDEDGPCLSGESVPAPSLDRTDAWSDTYARADREDEIAERQIRRERG